jgi:hypothetical protein
MTRIMKKIEEFVLAHMGAQVNANADPRRRGEGVVMSHYCTLPECTIDFWHYHLTSGETMPDKMNEYADLVAEVTRLKADNERMVNNFPEEFELMRGERDEFKKLLKATEEILGEVKKDRDRLKAELVSALAVVEAAKLFEAELMPQNKEAIEALQDLRLTLEPFKVKP